MQGKRIEGTIGQDGSLKKAGIHSVPLRGTAPTGTELVERSRRHQTCRVGTLMVTMNSFHNCPQGHWSGRTPCHEWGVRWKSKLSFPQGSSEAATFKSSKLGAEWALRWPSSSMWPQSKINHEISIPYRIPAPGLERPIPKRGARVVRHGRTRYPHEHRAAKEERQSQVNVVGRGARPAVAP